MVRVNGDVDNNDDDDDNDDDNNDDDNNDDDDDNDADANLRGHKNKKKDAAAIESEDDSTRGKFPACFQLFPPGSLAKKINLKMLQKNKT